MRLHAEIRACQRCALAGHIPRARPIVAGSARDRVMIVGQAPGALELETGQPFSGRSGAVLRRWLAAAGIGPDQLPYRTSITKCFPGKSPAGNGDRRPSPAEVTLCAPWLDREMALLAPAVILLVGSLAVERLWGRVPLERAVGRWRRQDGALMVPLPHPSGASRWLNDPAHRRMVDRALRTVRRELESLGLSGSGGPRPAQRHSPASPR
jgi:uracil-DNA glycosylase family 4